ncbi:hypothetical protein [Luteolibacter marinus]|uniref:hypothetical protein n=1 Tax=Luteolibacter marinus TaxID=2776705 RepID=UPI0018687C1D|nr:hypothetical protein [Luteolibacter marinus]
MIRTISLMLLSGSLFAAERAADFPAALDKAKAGGQDIAVLYHGSDWCAPGEKVAAMWRRDDFEKGMGKDVVLVAIDRKERPDEAEAATAKRNEACPVGVRSYPGIALFDAEGRLVAKREGMSEIESMGAPGQALLRAVEVRRKRDALWQRAAKESGPAAARLLGKGLDMMNLGLGPKDVYKPVLERIRKEDPEDRSGYVARYTFPGMKLVESAMKLAGEQKFEDADKEIAAWLSKRSLLPDQRQQALSARFALYNRWDARKGDVKSVLRELEKADPESELGKGAAEYLKMLGS